MPLPREVLPGRFYMVTRRCTQRMFLLRPDRDTNNAFLYCLAEAAHRFEIDVLLSCAMSNHHHTVIFDRCGNYPEFLEHFHKMVARSQNALRGRWENFWAASAQTSVVRLVDRADVIRKLVYAATNPVKDRLVDRVHHWPGVNTYRALRLGQAIEVARPRHFFRPNGPMPERVTFSMVIPEALGDAQQVVEELARGVAEVEARVALECRASATSIVGRANVLRQSWQESPNTFEQRRGLQPRLAARNMWSRIEALVRSREFVRAYREARRHWLVGNATAFPIGTYWLRRFANVPLVEATTLLPVAQA